MESEEVRTDRRKTHCIAKEEARRADRERPMPVSFHFLCRHLFHSTTYADELAPI
jgi:hypothetical protein